VSSEAKKLINQVMVGAKWSPVATELLPSNLVELCYTAKAGIFDSS
jgi:hypothetical protein